MTRFPKLLERRDWRTVCNCHERDSSYTCPACYAQGFRGHMESEECTDCGAQAGEECSPDCTHVKDAIEAAK